jgi:5-methylcytosine-specific restriction endonuclease McrA
MQISELVKCHIPSIINYCNNINHEEFEQLQNLSYSKKLFDINFPFFIKIENIDDSDNKKNSKRFWREVYLVRGKRVRTTSQWFKESIPYFIEYLKSKNINKSDKYEPSKINRESSKNKIRINNRLNSRYRGNAIGNAQNLLIRNILSNLGNESFTEEDWIKTKNFFNQKCAYCGSETELIIEHAIPINKEKLGEHRLGNIIPSCKKCNSSKSNKDYKEFLEDNKDAIKIIEEYMESKNYVPLDDNPQMKKILNMAYEEVATVADRYISIINELFISE